MKLMDGPTTTPGQGPFLNKTEIGSKADIYADDKSNTQEGVGQDPHTDSEEKPIALRPDAKFPGGLGAAFQRLIAGQNPVLFIAVGLLGVLLLFGAINLLGAVNLLDLKPSLSAQGARFFQDGRAFSAQGNFNEAETAFRKAVESDPSNSAYHAGLGFAIYRQGNYPEADAEYRKAIAADPRIHMRIMASAACWAAKRITLKRRLSSGGSSPLILMTRMGVPPSPFS